MSVLYVIDHTIDLVDDRGTAVELSGTRQACHPAGCVPAGSPDAALSSGVCRKAGPHLIADAREATLAAAPDRHWRRRLIAGVRHRLEREEVVG